MFSCANKKEKTVNEIGGNDELKTILEKKQEPQSTFYNNDKNLKTFDFNQLPLSKTSINDNLKFRIEDNLKNEVLKKDYYYNLINYSNLIENKEFKVFTVLGGYDYYTNVILLTTNIERDSLIDYKIIASVMGDADNITEISTIFLDSITFEVTNNKKRLTKNDGFKILDTSSKIYKITTNGQIK
ncbi:hypothetical protein Lupro_01000 [Lutibacter profundi]|uniref:Uncharacterized protein n=2 Tax=Lutibacter profundi TaxID=1622118 RepID=A0A0X8G4H9_9FLAO|nr:hypothetical protein Lupro_01000 [Lutibacter profundi]